MADKKISVIVEAVVGAANRNLESVNRTLNSLAQRFAGTASDAEIVGKAFRTDGISAKEAARWFKDFGFSAKEVQVALKAAGYEADVTTRAFDGAKEAVVLFGAAFVAVKLGDRLVELAETGAAAERLAEGFDTLAARSQVDSGLLLNALKEASRGTISEYELMEQANKAWYLGIANNVQQYAELMKIAEVKSKDLGISTVKYWERLTSALASGMPITMRQLGIVIDTDQAYRDWAAIIGVAAGELTDQEKVQARVNAVLADGEPTLRRWEEAERDAMTVTQDFRAATADLALEIQKELLPVLMPAIDWITRGLRGVEAGMAGQNAVMAELIVTTGSAANAEAAFAERIALASGGLIDQTEAARLAHIAMLDYQIDLVGIDKGIREDVKAMRMAEQATIDWAGALGETQEDLQEKVESSTKAWLKYFDAVASENASFTRRMADLEFRQTQALENATFQRGEIERRAAENRQDLLASFDRRYEYDLESRLSRIRYTLEDHYDKLAEMEYDYQQDIQQTLDRAPWMVRQALQAEFTERERIAKTGDKAALQAYDKALRERIRLIDPIYAKMLDKLEAQYQHELEIEEREQDKGVERERETWDLRLREQEEGLQEQLRQLDRQLENQRNAWNFSNEQRLENERRALDNLNWEHAHRLDQLKNDLESKLAEINRAWEHWGYTHGVNYIQKLQEGLSTGLPMPTGAATPPGYTPYQWFPMQRGAWDIPRDMPAMLDKGEMVVPAAAAERIREGGGAVSIHVENLVIGPGVTPMTADLFVRDTAEELGRLIRERRA